MPNRQKRKWEEVLLWEEDHQWEEVHHQEEDHQWEEVHHQEVDHLQEEDRHQEEDRPQVEVLLSRRPCEAYHLKNEIAEEILFYR